jgi:hypothetical protein
MSRATSASRLAPIVQAKLQLQWSPAQIAVWLRAEYPIQPQRCVCHEPLPGALFRWKTLLDKRFGGQSAPGGDCACCGVNRPLYIEIVFTLVPKRSGPCWFV